MTRTHLRRRVEHSVSSPLFALGLMGAVAACGGLACRSSAEGTGDDAAAGAELSIGAKGCFAVARCFGPDAHACIEAYPKLTVKSEAMGSFVTVRTPAMDACLASAADCEAVGRCIYPGAKVGTGCARAFCDGNRVLSCVVDLEGHSFATVQQDCTPEGFQCFAWTGGHGLPYAVCRGASCDVATTAAACAPDGHREQCVPLSSSTGASLGAYLQHEVCASGCADGSTGKQCAPPPACSPGCSGDVLTRCETGGAALTIDCAAGGLRCDPAVARCAAAAECDASHHVCNGEALSFCDFGRLTTVTCSALGFTTCQRVEGRNMGACR